MGKDYVQAEKGLLMPVFLRVIMTMVKAMFLDTTSRKLLIDVPHINIFQIYFNETLIFLSKEYIPSFKLSLASLTLHYILYGL